MLTIPKHVAFEQVKQEILKTVNNSLQEPINLELYELEIILRDIYNEVTVKARQVYHEKVQAYNQALKTEQENQEKSEN